MVFDRGDIARDYINGGDGNDTLMGDTGDILNGGTGADTFSLMTESVVTIEDFDRDEDTIEITFTGDVPILATQPTAEGVTLFADGEPVATFDNITSLDLERIVLIAV